MTVHRVDWSTLALGRTGIPCLLIAGCPYVLLPRGAALTSVVWTDEADAAWHLGASPTTKPWLKLSDLVLECTQRLPGEAPDVSGLTVELTDPSRDVTSYLGGRRAMARTLLTATATASATTLSVERTDGFPASGTLHVGGERVTYTGVTSTTFTGCTRGTGGTRARRHVLRGGMFALEVFGGAVERLPSLRGRRATLWMLALSGGVATDPTLLWDGVVGAGAEVAAGWRLPLVPAVRALEAKLRTRQVTLSGYSHEESPGSRSVTSVLAAEASPVAVYWNGANLVLTSDTASPDMDGWHATRESYVTALRAAADAAGAGVSVHLGGDNHLNLHAVAGSAETLTIKAPWTPEVMHYAPDAESTDTDVSWRSGIPMPEVCVWLGGRIHLSAIDMGVVPSVPSVTAGSTHTVAYWTLTAKCSDGETRTATISTVGTSTITVGGITTSGPWGRRELLITARTPATLGLYAASDVWWDAIRYGILGALDADEGTGQLSDAVDWTDVAAVARRYASALPARRRYSIGADRAFVEILTEEGAANGLSLVQRKGRLTFIRPRDVASTEPVSATLTASDLAGVPQPRWSTQGLATTYTWELPDGSMVRVLDSAAEDEAGQGKEIKAKLPAGAFDGYPRESGPALIQAFEAIGSQVLGPVRQEYQEVVLPLPLCHAGLEIGDTLRVSEYLTPPGDGTRGLSAAALVVTGKRLLLGYGSGQGSVELTVRVSDPTIVGYAPEALIAAGGITAGSAVLTLDISTLGTDGFALDGRGCTDGFSVGDKCRLIRFDSTSTTSLAVEIASIDPLASTITLTATVAVPWDTYASVALGVMLVYDDYADADNVGDPPQHSYAFIATSGSLLDGTDAPHRYAP